MRYKGKKGKAWEAVKAWCRRTFTDCYTCPAKDLVGQNSQSGHCWPVAIVGSNNTLSWDHRQIRLQCGRCNGVGQGMQDVFKRKLIQEHGEEVVKSLEARIYKVDPVQSWDAIESNFKSL